MSNDTKKVTFVLELAMFAKSVAMSMARILAKSIAKLQLYFPRKKFCSWIPPIYCKYFILSAHFNYKNNLIIWNGMLKNILAYGHSILELIL